MSEPFAAKKWAAGVVVTTSGLGKAEKLEVQKKIKQAGGDYSPNLSRRCTHVLTRPGAESQKLDAIFSNPQLWPQAVIALDWLKACDEQAARLPPGPYTVKQQAAESRKPLGPRQPAASSQQHALLTAGARTRDGPAPGWAAPSTTTSGARVTAAPMASSRPAGTRAAAQPAGVVAATPWVLQPSTFVKPELPSTANKPAPGPWKAAATHATVDPPQLPPAPATATAQKPAPWRVHFSQVEEDPLDAFHTGAPVLGAAEVARRPWRVRVSSIIEEEPRPPSPAAAAAAKHGQGRQQAEAELGANQKLTNDGSAEDVPLGGGGALPPVKPWHVRHMDESAADDDGLPAALLQPQRAGPAGGPGLPQAPPRRGGGGDAPTASSSGGGGTHRAADRGPPAVHWSQDSNNNSSSSQPDGMRAGAALLEALTSPRSSQGSVLGTAAAATASAAATGAVTTTGTSGLEPGRSLPPPPPHCMGPPAAPPLGRSRTEGLSAAVTAVANAGQRLPLCAPEAPGEQPFRDGIGGGVPGRGFAYARDDTDEPPFPSLTQIAADMQALRQDFAVIPPLVAEAEEEPPQRMPRSSSPRTQATGRQQPERQWGHPPTMWDPGAVGDTDAAAEAATAGEAGPGWAERRPFFVEANAAAGRGDSSPSPGAFRGGEQARKRDQWAEEHDRSAHAATRAAAGVPGYVGGHSGGESDPWESWAPPLSQLAAEMAEARRGLGVPADTGATDPIGISDEGGDSLAVGQDPAPSSLLLVPVDMELGRPQLRRPAAPPPDWGAGAGGTGARDASQAVHSPLGGQGGPFSFRGEGTRDLLAERAGLSLRAHDSRVALAPGSDAGLDVGYDVDGMEADREAQDVPGPMTQLLEGLREAREGLQRAGPPALSPPPAASPPAGRRVPELGPLAAPHSASAEWRDAATEPRANLQHVLQQHGDGGKCDDGRPMRSASPAHHMDTAATPGGRGAGFCGGSVEGRLPGGGLQAWEAAAATEGAAGMGPLGPPPPGVGHSVNGGFDAGGEAAPSLTQLLDELREAREGLRVQEWQRSSRPAVGLATDGPVPGPGGREPLQRGADGRGLSPAGPDPLASGPWTVGVKSAGTGQQAAARVQGGWASGAEDAATWPWAAVEPGRPAADRMAAAAAEEEPPRAHLRAEASTGGVPRQFVGGDDDLLGPSWGGLPRAASGLGAATLSPNGPDALHQEDAEGVGAAGAGGGGGANDDISFSELLRLMQRQKLGRQLDEGTRPSALHGGAQLVSGSAGTEPPLVDGAGRNRDLEGWRAGGGGHQNPSRTSHLAGGASQDLPAEQGSLMDWERPGEPALGSGVSPVFGPGRAAPRGPVSEWGTGGQCSPRWEQRASSAAPALLGCEHQNQGPSPAAGASAGSVLAASLAAAPGVGGAPDCEVVQPGVARVRVSPAEGRAAAAAAAATTPLMSLQGSPSFGPGGWQGRSTQPPDGPGTYPPSPGLGPSPALHPVALLGRFDPTAPLHLDGSVTPTASDTGTCGEAAGACGRPRPEEPEGLGHLFRDPAVVGPCGDPAASVVGELSLADAAGLGPGASSPSFQRDDGLAVGGFRTPGPAESDFSFDAGGRSKLLGCSGRSAGRAGAGADGGGSGCRSGCSGGGDGGSKPAARKMAHRTPPLNSAQGRRKRREPKRLTPIAMRVPTSVPAEAEAAAQQPKIKQDESALWTPGPCGTAGDSMADPASWPPAAGFTSGGHPPGSNRIADPVEVPVAQVRCKEEPGEPAPPPGIATTTSFTFPPHHYVPSPPPPPSSSSVAATAAPTTTATAAARLPPGHHSQGAQSQHQPASQAPRPSQASGPDLRALLRSTQLSQDQRQHSQGSVLPGSQLRCSSAVPLAAPASPRVPVLTLKGEETLARRSQMPWAATRPPGPQAQAQGVQGVQRNSCGAATRSLAEDPMPVTPGPWLDGGDSDDEPLDVEALVAAGRAAVGLTPGAGAGGGRWSQTDLLGDPAVAGGGGGGGRGVGAGSGKDGGADLGGMEQREAAARAAEAPAGHRSRLRLRRRSVSATDGEEVVAAGGPSRRITKDDVLVAAAQPLPSDSRRQPQPPFPPAVAPLARRSDTCGAAPTLAEATAALGSLGLDDVDAMDDPVLDPRPDPDPGGCADLNSLHPGSGPSNSPGLDLRPDRFSRPSGSQPQVRQQEPPEPGWRPDGLLAEAPRVSGGRRESPPSGTGGLLEGATVIIDRCLDRQQSEGCIAAVEALGGHVSASSHLGCGATVVVCDHSRASRWLAWGAHLISPRSLSRLAGSSTLEVTRAVNSGPGAGNPPGAGSEPGPSDMVCISRGILHVLQRLVGERLTEAVEPDGGCSGGGPGTTGCAGRAGELSAALAGCRSSGSAGGQQEVSGAVSAVAASAEDAWPSREARRKFVLDLKAAEAAAGTRLHGLGLAGDHPGGLQHAAPLALLENLVWAVTEPPERAQVICAGPTACDDEDEDFSAACGDDEEGGEAGEPGFEALFGRPVSQATLSECRAPGSSSPGRRGAARGVGDRGTARGEPRLVAPCDLDTVAFTGPRVTLLLPRDQYGILGHDAVTLPQRGGMQQPLASAFHCKALVGSCVGRLGSGGGAVVGGSGIIVRELLLAIHQYYLEHMSAAEVAVAMASHPALRRELQVAWQTLSAVRRSDLLGRKLTMCGLRRCSHSGSLAVYELHLMG